MANILFSSSSAWQDAGGANPPACWDGTKYVIAQGSPQTLTYLSAPPVAGDTIKLIASWDGSSASTPIVSLSDSGGTLAEITTAGGAGTGQLEYTITGSEPDLILNAGYGGENTYGVTLTAPPIVAPDEHLTVPSWAAGGTQTSVNVTPAITQGGDPVTPTNLLVASFNQPAHGTATPANFSDTDIFLTYQPEAGFVGTDTFEYYAYVDGVGSNLATVTVDVTQTVVECNYNCDCDDTTNNRTLASLRTELAARLGYAAQGSNLPPGMVVLLNSFLIEAQELLYRRYDVLRTERFYTWDMTAGTRLYDLDANRDTCTKQLDPRKITWAGVSEGCGNWTELRCGINPLLYTTQGTTGRPWYYEIRQCIEVWPAPADDSYQLRIKGHFGLEAFAADTDKTTIDDRLVFLLALANAKAHYGKPDAQNYVAQMEAMMLNLVAGAHQTRRYITGRDRRADGVYTMPVPLVPFE